MNPILQKSMRSLCKNTEKRSQDIRQRYNLVEMWEHEFLQLKKNDLELKAFLEQHKTMDRLNPRDAFFGGRTNAVTLFYEGKAKYIDFTSLYPWVNKYARYYF